MIKIVNNTHDEDLDVLICALGFEERSSFIAISGKINYKKGIAFSFSDRNELSYSKNLDNFKEKDFLIKKWDEFLVNEFLDYLDNLHSEKILTIGLDVSSMTRKMVAKLIYTLSNETYKLKKMLKIKILYAPAKYTEPKESLSTIEVCGPVIEEYARCSLNLNKPLYCLIGLGYEYGRAIGVMEMLDVSDSWVFKPIGTEKEYLEDVQKINQDLLLSLSDKNIIDYKINDPYDLFYKMRSLTEGLIKESRIVIIPFGPKLFNVISILITELYENDISIWRVSPGILEEPVQQIANGDIIELSFEVNN